MSPGSLRRQQIQRDKELETSKVPLLTLSPTGSATQPQEQEQPTQQQTDAQVKENASPYVDEDGKVDYWKRSVSTGLSLITSRIAGL